MKTLITAVSLALLVGCSPAEVPRDNNSRAVRSPAEVCINGVVYYVKYSVYGDSYSPKFKPDSTVETCN